MTYIIIPEELMSEEYLEKWTTKLKILKDNPMRLFPLLADELRINYIKNLERAEGGLYDERYENKEVRGPYLSSNQIKHVKNSYQLEFSNGNGEWAELEIRQILRCIMKIFSRWLGEHYICFKAFRYIEIDNESEDD